MVVVVSDNRQTLADIAIRHLGSVEGVYDLAQLNSLSATSELTVGQQLLLPTVINQRVVDYYAQRKITPATADK